eukprot:PhM_4_TR11602/c0_g1_i1/m.60681
MFRRAFLLRENLYPRLRGGYIPPVSRSRNILLTHYHTDLMQRGVTDASLLEKGPRELAQLLLQIQFERFHAVPFRLVAFDLEFTDIPRFTSEGPTAGIIEIGLFHPESGKTFERLVKPVQQYTWGEGVEALTGISKEMVENEGVSFAAAWAEAVQWVLSLPVSSIGRPEESLEDAQRCLLLSHGGRLADVSMLKWHCQKAEVTLPESITFGDTYSIIRERHRRRPVTSDRLPPAWGLEDLRNWMRLDAVDESHRAHRALPDAKSTWQVCEETLRRYGTEYLTPKQQLSEIFYRPAQVEDEPLNL